MMMNEEYTNNLLYERLNKSLNRKKISNRIARQSVKVDLDAVCTTTNKSDLFNSNTNLGSIIKLSYMCGLSLNDLFRGI